MFKGRIRQTSCLSVTAQGLKQVPGRVGWVRLIRPCSLLRHADNNLNRRALWQFEWFQRTDLTVTVNRGDDSGHRSASLLIANDGGVS